MEQSTSSVQPQRLDISGQISGKRRMPIAGVVVNVWRAHKRARRSPTERQLQFRHVETSGFYTVTPSLVNYSFGPASRSFSQLGNKSEAVFTGTPSSITVGNSIDTPEYFVRQHYLDFLGREPDEAGFNSGASDTPVWHRCRLSRAPEN